MAFVAELTDQIIQLGQRLGLAEAEVIRQKTLIKELQTSGGSREQGQGQSSVFDKKRLYPKDLREGSNFKRWSEWFVA